MIQARASIITFSCLVIGLGLAGPAAGYLKNDFILPEAPESGQSLTLPSADGLNAITGQGACPDSTFRQPINVGPNSKVGSGARSKQKAADTAKSLIGGFLGGGGGGSSRGRDDGPRLARCKIKKKEMTVFSDPESGIELKVGARYQKDDLVVYASVDEAPGNGTFQTAFLENGAGETLAPEDVGICKLWGEWKLTVSWTKTTYVDGQKVSEEHGGWSESGKFSLPGVMSTSAAPDGLWRRLGFSNASHGARMISMHYPKSAIQSAGGRLDTIIHVTRPDLDPVTTVPFALSITETADGFAFSRAPDPC